MSCWPSISLLGGDQARPTSKSESVHGDRVPLVVLGGDWDVDEATAAVLPLRRNSLGVAPTHRLNTL